jgi:hypothetical protein
MKRMGNLEERLRWRAHGCENAEIAAGDYISGLAEKEEPYELHIRLRRALWEQWVCRQAVSFLTELDQDASKAEEIAAVWDAYEQCAESAVICGVIPEFETWVKERLPVTN